MGKLFFHVLFGLVLLWSVSEGAGCEPDLQTLYEKKLKPVYQKLQPARTFEQKRKQTIWISLVLAITVFLLFAKFFKLPGVIVALLMIGAGTFVIMRATPKSHYPELFKAHILSPIAQACCGYHYQKDAINGDQIKRSPLFAPSIKNYTVINGFGDKQTHIAFVVLAFDTKENASVERLNQNRFEGYFVIIDKPNPYQGAVVSERLRDQVAHDDLEMQSFFAKGKRGEHYGSWQLYGNVDSTFVDKLSGLEKEPLAIGFDKAYVYIALSHQGNPFDEKAFENFDLQSAQTYQQAFETIAGIIQKLR